MYEFGCSVRYKLTTSIFMPKQTDKTGKRIEKRVKTKWVGCLLNWKFLVEREGEYDDTGRKGSITRLPQFPGEWEWERVRVKEKRVQATNTKGRQSATRKIYNPAAKATQSTGAKTTQTRGELLHTREDKDWTRWPNFSCMEWLNLTFKKLWKIYDKQKSNATSYRNDFIHYTTPHRVTRRKSESGFKYKHKIISVSGHILG